MIYYKKNHWYSILINFYKIVRKFWALIILIIIPSLSFGFLGISAIFGSILVFCIVEWANEFIIINEEGLFYKRGIVIIEEIKLPISSISLIEFNRNIIHKILGLSRIKIESISPNDRKFGIIMVLKKQRVIEFQSFINQVDENVKDNIEIDSKKSYKILARHLLILATLRSNILVGIGMIYSIIKLINEIDKRFSIDLKNYILYNIKYGLKLTSEIVLFLSFVLIVLIVCIGIILSFSIIGLVSKYYKFKLDRKNNHLYVNHGLIVRKRYSIKIENIHAIKIEQNFINQILNFYTIKASVVGYGNEMSEDEVIFPLCTESGVTNIIKEMIPEFEFDGEKHIPPRKSFNNFFISWTSYAIIFTVIIYCVSGSPIGGFAIPLMILWRYLIRKNASLGISGNLFFFSSGSFLRRLTLIRSSSMVECCQVINVFQRRKKICDYRIRFYNQKKFEWIRIKNMDDFLYEDIKSKMKSKNI